MKSFLRHIFIYTLALLSLLEQLVPGVTISGSLWTLFTGGLVLTLLFVLLRPILSIISFPVNLVTLGIFNIFINALLLYLLTVFVTEVSIAAFTYERMNFIIFTTNAVTFNTFFAYIYTAFVLTVIEGVAKWLMK